MFEGRLQSLARDIKRVTRVPVKLHWLFGYFIVVENMQCIDKSSSQDYQDV